jgi:1,4-dihydroxy-2-naphthoyl-CoA hydrolase
MADAPDALRDAMPLARTLGMETLVADASDVRARVTVDERLSTSDGVLHGGVIMALADSTGALCAFLNLPDGAAGTTTIESKTNFLRAVRGGTIEARSTPLHAGRTVVVVVTDVLRDDGQLAARVTQTQAVLWP